MTSWHIAMAWIVIAAVTTGCVPSQEYPAREFFGVDPGRPEPAAASRDVVLRVSPVRVASPFATQKFTYRSDADAYQTDYYYGFVDSPDRLLTASLTEWLASGGVCRAVIDIGSEAQEDIRLETSVVELYGDYRDPKQPRAVLAVRFLLLQRQRHATRVLSEHRSDIAIPLPDNTPATLARGLGQAWRTALTELSTELGRTP